MWRERPQPGAEYVAAHVQAARRSRPWWSVRPAPPSRRRPLFGLARFAVRGKRVPHDRDRLVRGETLDVDAQRLNQIVELGRLARTIDEGGDAERALDDERRIARMEA